MINRSSTLVSLVFVLAMFLLPSGAAAQTTQGWTFCAYEGGFCSFSGTMQVRYGGNGLYNYKTVSGGTACTNSVFGDPAVGATKHCDFGPPPSSSDWTFCAYEGGFCSFSGTLQVRYGANGAYSYKTVSGGTACTNTVFGDPLLGATKHCDFGLPAAPAPTGWTFCAYEGGFCSFSGSQQVRYGANGAYNYKTLSGGTACTNTVFGDPAVGATKHCDFGGTSTTPTLTGLSISGSTSVTVGQTAQYTARATYSDGSSQNLTTGPAWSTSNSGLATITQAGVLTALAAGTVGVQVSYGGLTATALSVTQVSSQPTLTGLSISGSTSVTVGQTAPYTARATYSDGSSQNLTSGPSWSTSNGSLGTISSVGVLSALSAGTVNVQASYSGVSATPVPVTLAASAAPPSPGDIYVSTTGSDSNSGSPSSPVQTISRGVVLANQLNAAGTASHIYIAAGVYREAVILDATQASNAAMIIEGAPGTVLSGADLWNSGWTSIGNNSYTHAWPYRWGSKGVPAGWEWYWTQDGLGSIRNRMLRSEMVFVNGQPLGDRLSANELTPGTFYVNEAAGVITVMLLSTQTAPISNYQVEVAVRFPVLTLSGRRNVTIKGLQVEKGRGALQDTMASAINSTNIVLDGVVVRHAGATGWGSTYTQGLTIRNSQFVDNGVSGLSAQRDKSTLLETSIIARNNWRGWANEVKGYDAVFKWGGMRDAIVRQTQFTDNWGSGFWLDYDNQRVTADQIFSARNQSAGVTMEMNPGPITISNSKFCNNDTGVEDARTNYLTLTNNKIFNNKNAELLFTGSGTPVNVPDWETGVVRVTASLYHVYTGNTFYGTGPAIAGIAQWLLWGPFGTIYTNYFRPTVRSDNNIWYHADRTNALAVDNLSGGIDFWSYQLDALRSANHWNHSSNPNSPNNESHSTWTNPGTLSCSWP